MGLVVCPHCNSHRFVPTKVPKEVIVVMKCPVCRELSVIYGGKIVALNRKLLARGDLGAIKEHLAQVIGEFIHSDLFSMLQQSVSGNEEENLFDTENDEPVFDMGDGEDVDFNPAPITQQELDRFAKIELKCLDDPAYFKKHFG